MFFFRESNETHTNHTSECFKTKGSAISESAHRLTLNRVQAFFNAMQPAHTNIESMQPANRLNYILCLCPSKPCNYSETV